MITWKVDKNGSSKNYDYARSLSLVALRAGNISVPPPRLQQQYLPAHVQEFNMLSWISDLV